MDHFFEEKSHQVEPGVLIAFGIKLSSRYAKAHELIEMLRFAQQAAVDGLAHYVKEVFYDTKAGVCSFTLDPAVKNGNPVAAQLYLAAKASIQQFMWIDGCIAHGPFVEVEEEV